jgi:hypothetical protein
MRTTQLLATAAAVVLIGGGIAAAQEMKKDEHPARAPAAQQHAPAEKIAPPIAQGARKAPETVGQGAKDTDHNVVPRAGEKAKPETTGKANETKSNETKSNETTGNASETKANETKGNESKAASGKTETRATTGQGTAAGAAKLTSAQRTKITTIFHEHRVAPVHLNVSISVGTRIPPSVHLYPVPVEVITVYPEWRGYDYVMVGGEILVIDPGTHEIVAIIEA